MSTPQQLRPCQEHRLAAAVATDATQSLAELGGSLAELLGGVRLVQHDCAGIALPLFRICWG